MQPAHRLRALVGRDHASVAELLAARCRATPEAPFVLHRGRTIGYASAFEEMRRFAGFLEARVGPRPRVAVYLAKRPEALWAWFGTTLAGGIHIALHRAHKGEVLADLILRARADLLVTEAAALETLPPLDRAGVKRVLVLDAAPDPALAAETFGWDDVAQSGPGEVRASEPGDTVCVLFTSGTTGRSKAVLVPHNMYARGAAHLAHALALGPADVMHDWAPLSHVGGQLHMTLATAIAGGCLAMYDTFSRSRFWDQVRESRATCFFGFSNVISLLTMAPEGPADRDHALRLGVVAHMQAAAQDRFQRRFGVRLVDTYGMSECEPLTLPVPDLPLGCSGAVAPDFELAIADEDDRILPAGEVGRIVVRPRAANVIMKGYEDDAAATVAAWRNLWFHTQDLGRLDAHGFLWYVDRLKHSIRRAGENVSSAEVERALKAHPDVHDCAVVGVPDALTGEAVKAVVVARPGAALDPAALHAFAAANMARFMVPRYVELRDALPYTDVGKVRRDELGTLAPGTWDAEAGR